MIFEFIDKKYFYINDKLIQTDDKGHLELNKEDCDKILSGLGKPKDLEDKTSYAFIYNHLLSRQVESFRTVIKSAGNSARIPVPNKYLDYEAQVWVAYLDKIKKHG